MTLARRPFAALRPDTLAGVLRTFGFAAALWAVAAVLLRLLSPTLDTLPRLLVFSECVGLTMVACVLALRGLRVFARFDTNARWLLIGLVAIPFGYFVGHQFAFLILGEPLRLVGHEHVSVVPVLFTTLVGGWGFHSYATRELLAREAAARSEAQRLAVESQLRLLRAQLEPHMLFNTLANLRSLLREDVPRAESMIDQLIVYLRSALAASQSESVPLRREFAQLRAYLDIMSMRMGPRLTWRLDLPDALEAVSVPPMLLQPLLENAIKHGLEPKVGPGLLEVVARRTAEGVLEIRVCDSGLGLPAEVEDEARPDRPASSSYGLQHVRDRLLAVYGPAAGLRLERRQPTGVCAVVVIPDRQDDAGGSRSAPHVHAIDAEERPMTPAPASTTTPTALIAEDEPVLARTLARQLEALWPELRLVGMADDGLQATDLALSHAPDVLFLDIKMPGRTGLEVAEAVTDDWPDDRAEPLIVFVTAYDAFAVPAFERAAFDYLLKPVTPERLRQTVQRLQARLAERTSPPRPDERAALVRRMQALDAPAAPQERIKVIRAGVGNTVRMIPVSDVVCFEATEKYVNVVTPTGEALVRMSLRELMARIDSTDFMQVHRSVMVNAGAILSATRDENGHYSLAVRGLSRPLKVSRAFGHLFRPM